MSGMIHKRMFAGRYHVVERIGIGGMAEVFKAKDANLGREVAVKVMLPKYASDNAFLVRFKDEARAASALQNPHIVTIHDYGQDEDCCYIIMEYVRGIDLKTALKSRSTIHPIKVAEIAAQTCDALAEAHNHDIIHRDIKSSNIMMQTSGNIKVMDFGIAQAGNSGSKNTASASILGTAHYMSPEQAQGKVLTPASDLYSLGVVMYEIATGRLPFEAETPVLVAAKQISEEPVAPRQINPSLDADLERIIMQAMAKDPTQRFGNAQAMKRALEAYIATASARQASQPASGSRPTPSFWALAFLNAPAPLKGTVLKLNTTTVVGRSPSADITIPEGVISGKHMRLTPSGGYLKVEDLNSSNGTRVNGQLISQPVLCGPGDKISLGYTEIRIGCK